MRKLYGFLAALALTAFVAAPAAAAILPVMGTLTVAIGTLGGPTLTGAGVASSAGGTGSAFTAPAGLMSTTMSASVGISPIAIGLSNITLPANATTPVANAAGAFAGGSGAQGAMGNNGIANLFFTNGAPAGSVALNYVGGGGKGMATVASLPVTITGATWTNLGINAVTTSKQTVIMAAAAGIPVTATVTAFDNRTAGGAGTVQLLAPANANIVMGNLGALPVIGILTMKFGAAVTPEPGTLMLLGAGIAGLLAVGRKKARK